MKKLLWIGSGLVFGATTLSIAFGSVPRIGQVTNDSAIYQNLSEIRVRKDSQPNFDGDLATLNRMETSFHEKLPTASDRRARVQVPLKRISTLRYLPKRHALLHRK